MGLWVGILLVYPHEDGAMNGSLPPARSKRSTTSTPAVDTPDWFPLHWQLPSTTGGLQGASPLPWWSGDWYAGTLRHQLLQGRRGDSSSLDEQALTALIAALRTACPPGETSPWMLVPIPCRAGSTNGLPP